MKLQRRRNDELTVLASVVKSIQRKAQQRVAKGDCHHLLDKTTVLLPRCDKPKRPQARIERAISII